MIPLKKRKKSSLKPVVFLPQPTQIHLLSSQSNINKLQKIGNHFNIFILETKIIIVRRGGYYDAHVINQTNKFLFLYSTSNCSAQNGLSITNGERENHMDNQVAALQQAVALLQMGNMLEVDKGDNGEKMKIATLQNPRR